MKKGFGGVPGGTLRIPTSREDWGTLGKIRGITTRDWTLKNPIKLVGDQVSKWWC